MQNSHIMKKKAKHMHRYMWQWFVRQTTNSPALSSSGVTVSLTMNLFHQHYTAIISHLEYSVS